MNTACAAHAETITTHRAPWRRLLCRARDTLADAVQAWHATAQRQRQWRALQGLSERTRRDIGLADDGPPPAYGVSAADCERMRW